MSEHQLLLKGVRNKPTTLIELVDSLVDRVDNLANRFDTFDKRINDIESNIKEIKHEIDYFKENRATVEQVERTQILNEARTSCFSTAVD